MASHKRRAMDTLLPMSIGSPPLPNLVKPSNDANLRTWTPSQPTLTPVHLDTREPELSIRLKMTTGFTRALCRMHIPYRAFNKHGDTYLRGFVAGQSVTVNFVFGNEKTVSQICVTHHYMLLCSLDEGVEKRVCIPLVLPPLLVLSPSAQQLLCNYQPSNVAHCSVVWKVDGQHSGRSNLAARNWFSYSQRPVVPL